MIFGFRKKKKYVLASSNNKSVILLLCTPVSCVLVKFKQAVGTVWTIYHEGLIGGWMTLWMVVLPPHRSTGALPESPLGSWSSLWPRSCSPYDSVSLGSQIQTTDTTVLFGTFRQILCSLFFDTQSGLQAVILNSLHSFVSDLLCLIETLYTVDKCDPVMSNQLHLWLAASH